MERGASITGVQQLRFTFLLYSFCMLDLLEFGTRPGTNINTKLKVFLRKKKKEIGNIIGYHMGRLRIFSQSHQSS